ncbi:MAG: RCC1 domain-containing protein [Myxococcota bacterium]
MKLRVFGLILLAQHFEVVSDCGGALAPPVNDAPVTQLALGGEFGCAVKSGAVQCWGANAQGQLGRGSVTPRETRPGAVSLAEPVAQLAVGASTACARTVTGKVWCWGSNESAQLGAPEPAASATPLEVKLPVPIAKLALHSDYALALGSDGRLFGWGNNSEGTLARGDPNPMTWPVPTGVVRVAFEHRFTDVTAGQGHACGIERDGSLWCWGRNTRHELGTPSTEHQHRTPIKTLDGPVTQVVAGAFTACAIQRGELLCWSDVPLDDFGQVLVHETPTKVDLGGETPKLVDTQWFHFCALTTANRLWCWGRGIEGQLGLGMLDPQPAPRLVSGDVTTFATGFFFTCLQRADGTVACMGENAQGQLGLGDTDRRDVPTAQ